jgi:hypothetical protein
LLQEPQRFFKSLFVDLFKGVKVVLDALIVWSKVGLPETVDWAGLGHE